MQLNKQSRLISKVLAFGAVLLAVGCAQLSPQQISFEPSIPTEGLITGSGSVSLTSKDVRKTDVIGIRGGSYAQTSTITPKIPLTEVVQSIASQILEKGGFELTDSLPDKTLEIQITDLSFETTEQRASIKRNTAVAAVAVVVNKGNVTYQNNYKTTQYIETLGYPKEEENEELLNGVFDAVLERLFRDPELEAFLQ
jgi:uncharacterized lipoprotein